MKIDLHRHVGGSISPETVHRILSRQSPSSCPSRNEVRQCMTYAPGEYSDFAGFLRKFEILEEIRWDQAAIDDAAASVCMDLYREGIVQAELKTSLDKYVAGGLRTPADAVRLLYDAFQYEATRWGISVGLVLCLKYGSPVELQRECAALIGDAAVSDMLVGIDLVGDESGFDADFYAPLLEPWRAAGKGVEAHVGETGPARNVYLAVSRLGVERVAHGIRAVDSPDVLRFAVERGVCFDVAISSNERSGAASRKDHPAREMLRAGCSVTVGTDDPVILGTSLDSELDLLADVCGLSGMQLDTVRDNSLKFSFIGR